MVLGDRGSDLRDFHVHAVCDVCHSVLAHRARHGDGSEWPVSIPAVTPGTAACRGVGMLSLGGQTA